MANPKALKRWYAQLVDYGCVITGSSQVQIHHPAGRTYKQNKIHIGDVFAYPLHVSLHDTGSNHPLNVTHYRHRFTKEHGKERRIFLNMHEHIIDMGWWSPCTDEQLQAIADTKY